MALRDNEQFTWPEAKTGLRMGPWLSRHCKRMESPQRDYFMSGLAQQRLATAPPGMCISWIAAERLAERMLDPLALATTGKRIHATPHGYTLLAEDGECCWMQLPDAISLLGVDAMALKAATS